MPMADDLLPAYALTFSPFPSISTLPLIVGIEGVSSHARLAQARQRGRLHDHRQRAFIPLVGKLIALWQGANDYMLLAFFSLSLYN